VSITSRIEALKTATGRSLEEIRTQLGVSRGMFHYMRSGERNPSRKILDRLEAAERSAGLLAEPESSAGSLVLHARRSTSSTTPAPETVDDFSGLSPELRQAAETVAAVVSARLEARFKRLESALMQAAKAKS
jgi:transcriptional regulator with XRE-family HTH domain